jgi:hypothetical protein
MIETDIRVFMADKSAAQQIDDIIDSYGGWKGEVISQVRAIVRQADPMIVEEVKWKMRTRPEGLPVWSHDGIVCRTETFKDNVKLVFSKGARLKDRTGLFNARLDASSDRAIEFRDGFTIDAPGLKELVLEAVRLNQAK